MVSESALYLCWSRGLLWLPVDICMSSWSLIWPTYINLCVFAWIYIYSISSRQLQIEIGRYAHTKILDERIFQLCHWTPNLPFYEIRGRYHCLFNQEFHPLPKVMEYEDQLSLGFFSLELKRHKEKLLKDKTTTTQAHQERTSTTFFIPIIPHATHLSHWLLSTK